MMSDGQYYGRLSSRYISHSDRHVGHRLDLDKFGKGRDDIGGALSLAHCGRYADRAAVYSFSSALAIGGRGDSAVTPRPPTR